MQSADSITLSALLYDSYVSVMKDKAESFDGFIKWSNMLMQDYNEIDRYLIDAKAIYKNRLLQYDCSLVLLFHLLWWTGPVVETSFLIPAAWPMHHK